MTTFLLSVLYVLLTSLTFRIRGGLRIPFTDKKFPLNKWWFGIWIAIFMCILQGWSLPLFVTALIAGKMSTSISGWGSYIGAIISGQVSPNDKDDLNITEFVQVTVFTMLNKAKVWCDNHIGFKWLGKILPAGSYKEHGRLYGVITLSLRGGLTTFIIGLCAHSFLYMTVGLAQGLIYLLATKINKYIDFGKGGWNWGEWLYGGWLGLTALLFWNLI